MILPGEPRLGLKPTMGLADQTSSLGQILALKRERHWGGSDAGSWAAHPRGPEKELSLDTVGLDQWCHDRGVSCPRPGRAGSGAQRDALGKAWPADLSGEQGCPRLWGETWNFLPRLKVTWKPRTLPSRDF